MKLDDYRSETWAAVGALWSGFGDKPQEWIESSFPQAAPFVDESFEANQSAEATALQIVTQVLTAYIGNAMQPDKRRAALAELQQLIQMSFEEADGYPALPFVAHLVGAWRVATEWAGAGKVDRDGGKQLLRTIVHALNA